MVHLDISDIFGLIDLHWHSWVEFDLGPSLLEVLFSELVSRSTAVPIFRGQLVEGEVVSPLALSRQTILIIEGLIVVEGHSNAD
jgi:hypothetical protein